ncbi:MAG: hypothetical protein PH343_07300 [Nitrospira sp.]|nr:hypothetical protein [Nitrospira sp.]
MQFGINLTTLTTTYNSLVSTETNIRQNPHSPAEQYARNTGGMMPRPVTQPVKAELSGPQANPCTTIYTTEDTWLDQVHSLVQHNTCESAVWFDSFFGSDHVLLDLRPGTFIIFRNTARWTKGQATTYVGDFNLSLELPQFEKLLRKTRLFIESGPDGDRYTTQPGQPVQPGVNRETGVRLPIIGIRIDPYTQFRTLVSIDSGIKINIQPDAFLRMRYQYLRDFGKVYIIRYSEIAMWQAVEHFSATSQLDLERKITTFTLFRWGNSVTYIEGTPGITWNTGISFLTQLTSGSAISYDANMWGVNSPGWAIQNYRVGPHYRRNFYRPWLFFEVAPEVTWPKDKNGNRIPTYAFLATLEMQFGK